jgi:hypothetical protein
VTRINPAVCVGWVLAFIGAALFAVALHSWHGRKAPQWVKSSEPAKCVEHMESGGGRYLECGPASQVIYTPVTRGSMAGISLPNNCLNFDGKAAPCIGECEHILTQGVLMHYPGPCEHGDVEIYEP